MSDLYFKLMCAFGCEHGGIARRSSCRYNCCDSENCVIWFERQFRRLAAYESSGMSPDEVQKLEHSDASKEQCIIDQHGEIHRLRDELKRYKQAEQEGRLYNLPLKPGDTIYRPEALQFCWVITKVEIYEDEIVFIDDSDNIFTPGDIGKTVFPSKEAAEKALGVGE